MGHYREIKENIINNHYITIEEKEYIDSLNEATYLKEYYKKICVFGQGYVGLPLALSFAMRGCNTIGVDIDEKLVEQTKIGLTNHTEQLNNISIDKILKLQLENKRYDITTDGDYAVKNSNVIIITVGVPINNGKYVMDYLKSACNVIGRNIKKNDLIIIRSTVIPGTTEDFCIPILEKQSGLTGGKDFYIAYASERIAEGRAFEEFENMPTIVGAIDKESLKKAIKVLSIVCKAEIIPSSTIKAVETSKVFENVQRDVNIAMSQEFARFTEALNIDIFEVIKLANTHKRVNLLTPGPGVGGYCIPNAYYYLEPKAKEMQVDLSLLRLSRKSNENLPIFMANKVQELLCKKNKDIRACKIAVLGLSMKDYSSDDRISPPVDICKILLKKGANVAAFDPLVSTNYDFKVKSQDEALKDADVLMILSLQNDFILNDCSKISELMSKNPVCIDTKAVLDKEAAIKHGIILWTI